MIWDPLENLFNHNSRCIKTMAINQQPIQQSTNSTTIVDLLERILDKGIVISGDIKVKLVEVELLSIHIQLVVCSVDKAKEIGIDWWNREPQ